MRLGFLFQVVFDLLLAAALFVLFKKLSRPAKDDPRLSRGLQMLQSKIAILEDLSDRSELQVSQLIALLEQKARDVQNKIHQADRQIQSVQASIEKSMEVAKIFQDKIPHQEIIERQNTLKYVQAARMAHQGASVNEIQAAIDLPRGEIEFIAKVNRHQLRLNEESLPAWVQPPSAAHAPEAIAPAAPEPAPEPAPAAFAPRPKAADTTGPLVRKVEFPRISLGPQDLR